MNAQLKANDSMYCHPREYLLERDAVMLQLGAVKAMTHSDTEFTFQVESPVTRLVDTKLCYMFQGSGDTFWSTRQAERTATLWATLKFLDHTAFRLQVTREHQAPSRTSPMLVDTRDQQIKPRVHESRDSWVISTDRIKLHIDREEFRIKVVDTDGSDVTTLCGPQEDLFAQYDALPSGLILGPDRVRVSCSLSLAHDEKLLGMGEHFSGINRRGETIDNWSRDGLGNISSRAYKPIPFLLSSRGYGLFLHTACRFNAYLGSQSKIQGNFVIDDDLLDGFFFYGPKLPDVISQYTHLTGRAALPPKWSFGIWMGRNSYNTIDEVRDVAEKMDEMELPYDVIHLDPPWMGFPEDFSGNNSTLSNLQFDKKSFAEQNQINHVLKKRGIRYSLWHMPYMGPDSPTYQDAKRAGAVVSAFSPSDPVCEVGVIDFSNPEAVRWYQDQLKPLLQNGADVMKCDFSETWPPNTAFHGGWGRDIRNLMSLLFNKAAFDITEEIKGKGEGLIWARAGYAGSQRYPVHWPGDPNATWTNLPCVVRAGLSLGLCGFSFWANDVAGFASRDPNGPPVELYIRWLQYGMFCSHVRFHGNHPREPWNYGKQGLQAYRKYASLRYQLLPYIYSEARHAASEGMPMTRALALDYQDDPTVYGIDDQFLFGRDLLIAPVVVKGARTRKLYLPDGDWIDFWTQKSVSGSRWIEREAPLMLMPIYVRRGALIPMGAASTRVDPNPARKVSLTLYPERPSRQPRIRHFEYFDGQVSHSIQCRYHGDEITLAVPAALTIVDCQIDGGEARQAINLVRVNGDADSDIDHTFEEAISTARPSQPGG